MSLPTQEEIQQVLNERPSDGLFQDVKPNLSKVSDAAQELTKKISDLILTDMAYDFAVAKSLDDVGKVIEYLAQENQIESPEFSGKTLMANFSRISQFKLSLDFANLMGISGQAYEIVLKAEADRLWGATTANALKNLLVKKQQITQQAKIETGVKETK